MKIPENWILNSIQMKCKMDTIFMNSENSKTLEPHRLLLNLSDKINLKSLYYTLKNIKSHTKTINLKYQHQRGVINLNFLMDHFLYQISKIILKFIYIMKRHEKVADDPPIRIYVNKIENWITFKIKTGYYLELLTTEMMKLLESTKNKITKDKNCENIPHLKITKVVLDKCNIANNVH